VSNTGQLGTMTSSERFKKDIAAMDTASEAVLSLRPVTFHYKSDTEGTPQFGLIAEEVAKVNPALVLPDKDGKPYTVRYEAVNAMMLNEFLKDHKRVEELNFKLAEQETVIARQRQEFQTTVARQDKEIRALIATVKEQAVQIQKVSTQIEMSKAPLQLSAAKNR
jgi:septal ring factor EnvC (AmiA/AmiB activator)